MNPRVVDAIKARRFAGVAPNRRGHPARTLCVGFDVETANGAPFALGLQTAGDPVAVHAVNSKTALGVWADYVRGAMMRHGHPMVLVWAHNLRFDLGVILYPHIVDWTAETSRHGVVSLAGGGTLEYWFGKVTFARLHFRKCTALVVDTFRFFTMSLERAAAAIGITARKLPHPDGFGVRRIPLAIIRRYLERDVELVSALGATITAWQRDLDVYPAVSVAQLSMRLFRRRYVRAKWQALPKNVARAALLAYHAGRNGLYCRPGWRRVKLLDMNSAFPAAMRLLPSFSAGSWDTVHAYAGPWGFYRLYAGDVRQERYPILFDHDFKPLPAGPIREPVWIAGPELRAAIRGGLIRHVRCYGYVWRPTTTDRPLRAFVAENWRRRQRAATKENKTFYKLLLNSLYGKFAAKTELTLDEARKELGDAALADASGLGVLVAGAQFYPVAASWITSIVRVWLWEQERATDAFHSATDGLMVAPATRFAASDALGKWKCEGDGWALILRNKFYIVVDAAGRLVKAAYHGFDGSPAELVAMLKAGRNTYTVTRLRSWLESAAAGRRPFTNETRTFSISCDVAGYWPPPVKLTIPTTDGFSCVVYEGPGALWEPAYTLPHSPKGANHHGSEK